MSKELKALERIKNAPTIYVGLASDIYTRYSFECKEIENALKEHEQYKTIEEELCIDLITLFKAVKQGYVYRKIYAREEDIGTNNFEIVKTDFDLLMFDENHKSSSVLECACLGKTEEIDNYKQCYQFLNYISSYGKTWALTKEELE